MKPTYKLMTELRGVYEKIVDEFGGSKYYSWFPYLILYHEPDEDLFGAFEAEDVQEISINLATHSTRRSIIKTMLHEYCHFLQHPGWYTRYEKKFVYADHPYEKEAWEFADEHIHKFTDKKR